MKSRNFLFIAVLVTAITSSLAFKSHSTKRFSETASYIDPNYPGVCNQDEPTFQDECATYFTGAQCTCYDGETETFEPAYEDLGNAGNPCCCVNPLYNQF